MSKQQRALIILIIIIALLLILPLTLFLARQRQEIRKKAEETRKEITLSLDPQTNSGSDAWQPGQEKTIYIKIINISDKILNFRVVGLTLNFDPQFFEIQTPSLSCNSPFALAGGNASKVESNLISLVCYLPASGSGPNNPLSLNPKEVRTVGSFRVKIKDNPPGGTTNIGFIRSNIPEEESLEDLSKFGEIGRYNIIAQKIPTPTLTPTPKPTPTPTPRQTPTSTPKPTVTPTSTPSSNQCTNNGDINLDSRISEIDLAVLLISWSPSGPAPKPLPGYCSADLNNDGKVSEIDIMQLLLNWKP